MSINNKLVNFAQQELILAHNDYERNRIIASLEQLEIVLKNKLGHNVDAFIRFGSFTRNTILPRKYDPKSDIDLMVVFNTANGKKTPGTYRRNLFDIISLAYPNSVSKKDFPVVKLELNHIMFDIVPAYSENILWNTNYFIPGKEDTWRSTTPNDINKILSDKNQSFGNNIVRNTLRLCKCWNAGEGYPFESYPLEKKILDLIFFWGGDLYEKFTNTLNYIAGQRPGVRQALNYIDQYKRQNNEPKQLEWLQKLLPGLKF